MSDTGYEDPTIPPPGKRTGTGLWSIVPYLKKSIAAKPQAQPHAEFQSTLNPQEREPRGESPAK